MNSAKSEIDTFRAPSCGLDPTIHSLESTGRKMRKHSEIENTKGFLAEDDRRAGSKRNTNLPHSSAILITSEHVNVNVTSIFHGAKFTTGRLKR